MPITHMYWGLDRVLSDKEMSCPLTFLTVFCALGYSADSASLGCVVTTYPQRNGEQFVDAFIQSVHEQYDVLDGVDSRKK